MQIQVKHKCTQVQSGDDFEKISQINEIIEEEEVMFLFCGFGDGVVQVMPIGKLSMNKFYGVILDVIDTDGANVFDLCQFKASDVYLLDDLIKMGIVEADEIDDENSTNVFLN